MADQSETTGDSAETSVGYGPFPAAVARVNIPDPRNPGFRIVGYRVPAEQAPLISALYALEERDKKFIELEAANAR